MLGDPALVNQQIRQLAAMDNAPRVSLGQAPTVAMPLVDRVNDAQAQIHLHDQRIVAMESAISKLLEFTGCRI